MRPMDALRKAAVLARKAQGAVLFRTGRARARQRVERRPRPYRLHLGSGGVHLDGWINVDRDPFLRPDVVWDLTDGLPVPDGSCEAIYFEHVLEHFDVDTGLDLLRACRRALADGGVLRVAVPSLDYLLDKAVAGNWRDQEWLHGEDYRFIETRAEMLNVAFRWWGHEYLYDREELHRRLGEAGFTRIRDPEWGESEHAMLRGLETRGDSRLICEAEAP